MVGGGVSPLFFILRNLLFNPCRGAFALDFRHHPAVRLQFGGGGLDHLEAAFRAGVGKPGGAGAGLSN